MPNEPHLAERPAEVVTEKLRNANEHLTLATLQAQVEAETSTATAERLSRLVVDLEASQKELREKNEELENFHTMVVGRELNMMRLEKENERLRREVTSLKSQIEKP